LTLVGTFALWFDADMTAERRSTVIDPEVANDFLNQRRIAIVGVSEDRNNFARTVYRALRDSGREVVAVNPKCAAIDGDPCFPDLASIPGDIDGVIVMVRHDRAPDVARDVVARGIPRVWFFKGIGGEGSVSEAAVALCAAHGVTVVAGACPLMFIEPVGWFHRVHRAARRANGSLARAGAG
jgi:predicted CoA-binding protein